PDRRRRPAGGRRSDRALAFGRRPHGALARHHCWPHRGTWHWYRPDADQELRAAAPGGRSGRTSGAPARAGILHPAPVFYSDGPARPLRGVHAAQGAAGARPSRLAGDAIAGIPLMTGSVSAPAAAKEPSTLGSRRILVVTGMSGAGRATAL